MGLGLYFALFFICLLAFGAFLKSRHPKRSIPASLLFFHFAVSRIVLYSFHSSIDLGGEEAQRENDKSAALSLPAVICFMDK